MRKCLHDLCHLCADDSVMADALRLQEAMSDLVIAVEKRQDGIDRALADARVALVRLPKEAA